ncbi:hypothetical protein ABEH87_08870 [Erwinia sp. Eh17-17]|jgi:hypothetical protein|uniref:hypothetical protein n=1 Tax=Erwinia sp. Eh17-17 TaxID=3080330 RepID=UPI003207B127
MSHVFFEFDLEPGVKSVADLNYVLRDGDKKTAFVMSAEVAKFVKDALIINDTIISFKNCCFAFEKGAEFVEFDRNGKSVRFSEPVPSWFVKPGVFARSDWLDNHELADLPAPDFIKAFNEKFPDLQERRKHADYLFDLQLRRIKLPPSEAPRPVGNTSGKSTKPKVTDLESFQLFEQFFARLKSAVMANEFPTLNVLTASEDVSKVPGSYRQAIRTAMKAVTHELPVNNKRLAAGNPALFCAPVREKIAEIESIGLEPYYQELSKAIARADGSYIADFSFHYSKPHR